jgi:hypothetical protein
MIRKILIVVGFGVILLSSILAPAERASKDPSENSNSSSDSTPPQTDPVYFSLEGGTYNTPQTLVLTDSQPGAVIYYTTTPSTPVLTWNIYSPATPIIVNTTETITAIAIAPGYSLSGESAKAYRYSPAPEATRPYFSLAAGTYTTPQTLTLTSTTPNASFCYTTDGRSPVDSNGMKTAGCVPYTGPITVDHTELVEAVTIASGFNLSNISSKDYTFLTSNSSGNSLLGMMEGAIDSCSKISPGSMSGYKQVDQLFTNGQSVQAIATVRNSGAYKDAYQQVTNQLNALTAEEAVSACSNH